MWEQERSVLPEAHRNKGYYHNGRESTDSRVGIYSKKGFANFKLSGGAMFVKYVGSLSIILLITISNSDRIVAQSLGASRKNDELATRLIKNVELEGQLWNLLGRLALNYDIPIGLEISPDEQVSDRYRIEQSVGTVAD